MTREAGVELLGWDKGPLCRSWSHRISWMGLQLCWTNIYTVSCYWNILTRGDKNRQGDWKVRYTCSTFLLYLRIYYWIIHWSKLRKYNNKRGSLHLRVFVLFKSCKWCHSGMLPCILGVFHSLKCFNILIEQGWTDYGEVGKIFDYSIFNFRY